MSQEGDNPGSERREEPRFEVFGQAKVSSGGAAYVMPVRNISWGGLFLEGDPDDFPALSKGTKVEISLSGSLDGTKDPELADIRCLGEVVRVDRGDGKRQAGFGVTLRPADDDEMDRLGQLLLRVSGVPKRTATGTG